MPSYTEEGFSGSTRVGNATSGESGGPKRQRAVPTAKQRELSTAARARLKQTSLESALRRQEAADLYAHQQEMAREETRTAQAENPRPPLISRRGGGGGYKTGPAETQNYQKHTLIALTSAFIITMFTSKLTTTIGKVAKHG